MFSTSLPWCQTLNNAKPFPLIPNSQWSPVSNRIFSVRVLIFEYSVLISRSLIWKYWNWLSSSSSFSPVKLNWLSSILEHLCKVPNRITCSKWHSRSYKGKQQHPYTIYGNVTTKATRTRTFMWRLRNSMQHHNSLQ